MHRALRHLPIAQLSEYLRGLDAVLLSQELSGAGVSLREVRPDDASFLLDLFAASRGDAAILAHWPEAERKALISSQFTLQDFHYRTYYGDADFSVVMLAGVPIGRLILHRPDEDWRLVDIALVPEQRRQGLGTALLQALQQAAIAQGAARISLHVAAGNVARALYLRLGFVEEDNTGSHIRMAWTPVS